jgi:hypothetical protein
MNNQLCSLPKLAVYSKLGSLFYMGHIEHEKWVLYARKCPRDHTIVPTAQRARSDPQYAH